MHASQHQCLGLLVLDDGGLESLCGARREEVSECEESRSEGEKQRESRKTVADILTKERRADGRELLGVSRKTVADNPTEVEEGGWKGIACKSQVRERERGGERKSERDDEPWWWGR